MLMNLVLVLDTLSLPLDLPHLAAGLTVTCGGLAALAARGRSDASADKPVPPHLISWSESPWLLLPVGFGLTAIAIRAVGEPLSGLDTFFRWNFLAREMWRTGTLHFYPAVSAGDFLHYGWCDGIPPLISTLYLWAYCSLGDLATPASAPIVVAQAAVLFWLVGQLAAGQRDSFTGLAAMALLATNAWALWAVAIGQETGFTALSLLGMFYFFERTHSEPRAHWPVWAGIAAGTGALAREYGLAFILLGFLTMAWQRMPRRAWVGFAIAAGVIALPWYLRNGLKTGNPLWSQSMGGLFPTNPVSADYFRVVGEINSVLAHPFIFGIAANLIATATFPVALGVAGAIFCRREHAPWLFGIVTVIALWLWSVGQTSGGIAYSLRVLAPAFALGAVFAGRWLGRSLTPVRAPWLAVLFAALAAEAAVRSFFLPFYPSFAWWRQPAGTWNYPAKAAAESRGSANWQAMADSANGRKILVSDPACHAALVERGAKAVPFFSPEVEFLFGPELDFFGCVARLRTLGFRFVLMTRHNEVNDRQTLRHAFFRDLADTAPAATTNSYFVYDLYAATAPAERGAASPDGR